MTKSSNLDSLLSEQDKRLIQDQSKQAEQSGRWTQEMYGLAVQKRLFHIAVPQKYGGLESELPSLLDFLTQVSRWDGSFGWTLTLGAGAGVFGAYMDPAFAETYFADPTAFIAGSGFPSGTAKPVEEGYRVSGTWKYASGSDMATLFTASCRMGDGPKSDSIRAMAFRPDEVSLESTWNSYGLKATASNDFSVIDQFVPHARSFSITSDALRIAAPLYRFPFDSFAYATLCASHLGIALHFIDQAELLFQGKKPGAASQQLIADIRSYIGEFQQRFRQSVDEVWARVAGGQAPSREAIDRIPKEVRELSAVCVQACTELYRSCGMAVLDEQSTINRVWRDLMTSSQHAFLK
ncbi:MAG: hypothetical protein ACQETE_00760 [Bacteroidota bacterium]